MARIRLQIIGEVLFSHARIKLASIGFVVDAAAIAVADEVIKLANKELSEKLG